MATSLILKYVDHAFCKLYLMLFFFKRNANPIVASCVREGQTHSKDKQASMIVSPFSFYFNQLGFWSRPTTSTFHCIGRKETFLSDRCDETLRLLGNERCLFSQRANLKYYFTVCSPATTAFSAYRLLSCGIVNLSCNNHSHSIQHFHFLPLKWVSIWFPTLNSQRWSQF